jgi:hypothetical protein
MHLFNNAREFLKVKILTSKWGVKKFIILHVINLSVLMRLPLIP